MQYARRAVQRRPSMRALLVLGGLVLMIIVGLLGMHTFSAEAAGHGTASVSHTAVTSEHPESGTTGALSDTSAECNAICHANTQPGHGQLDMATACVLALLVGILLLAPPILLYGFRPLEWGTASSWRLTSTSVLPRAPSLIVLSISRT